MGSKLLRDSKMGTKNQRSRRKVRRLMLITAGALAVLGLAATAWVSYRAHQVNIELQSAFSKIAMLERQVGARDPAAIGTMNEISGHTSKARQAVEDPVWRMASFVPVLGPNVAAVREVTLAADEVAAGAAKPMVSVALALDPNDLRPEGGRVDIGPIAAKTPVITAAARIAHLSHERLREIDSPALFGQVADGLAESTKHLGRLDERLSTVAHAAVLLPSMLGATEPRNYLVLVQNNAEVRATGGLPGALILLRVEEGSIEFVKQSSGSSMGKAEPPVSVDDAQETIFSTRLGSYIGDVNLTPDFPTAATTAKAMWERLYEETIDGVVAIDPVAIAHLLRATGPVATGAFSVPAGLPTELTAENAVPTLLSDVYGAFESNTEQDSFFASASSEIFRTLASGGASGPALMEALSASLNERRLFLWSAHGDDQDLLINLPLGGSIAGPAAGGATFGVYFNDGTGAKMDYHVRRTVQLEERCTGDDYSQYKVKVSLTNTAPADAGLTLPPSVTGAGRFGIPPGSVQTNVVVYGPSLSQVDSAKEGGTSVSFGSHLHGDRPVGVHTVRLAPGQTTHLEMVFMKVVQRADPTLAVTPTVQPAIEVILPSKLSSCHS